MFNTFKTVILTRSKVDQYRHYHSAEFNSEGVELTISNFLCSVDETYCTVPDYISSND